mgnify:CR=1 FL=1
MSKTKHQGPGKLAPLPCAVIAAVAMAPAPVIASGITEALADGKANLDLRYRYEAVSQDNALEDASASTVRTRLGYMTGEFVGLSGFFEFEYTSAFLV